MVLELLLQRIVVEFVVEQVGQRSVALLDVRVDSVSYRLGCVLAFDQVDDLTAHAGKLDACGQSRWARAGRAYA
ncbi:hypothetical protein GCM10011608_54600 [Micromonospora sonchi]|uniref:Uncharacterized protein n=1 Tax=Micromonospora sonchi TaxID=1763543 RepID=A0A917U6W9_9ACTN|nr:hypothetical protein [Micromonospora sonchi]GGM62505.1 hypothetical protein GCM10011608_54600 [Micromonospora sonchi]